MAAERVFNLADSVINNCRRLAFGAAMADVSNFPIGWERMIASLELVCKVRAERHVVFKDDALVITFVENVLPEQYLADRN